MVRKIGWLVVLMLLAFSVQTAAAQITAVRDISPTTVQPGGTVTVSVTITATEDVYAPLLDENPPEGWTVTPVENAGFTFKESEVKWLLLGQMSAGESKTIVYDVTVPEDATEGTYYITGNVSAYGVEAVPVSGDSEIKVTVGQPKFMLYNPDISPNQGVPPFTVYATGAVANVGTATGDYTLNLVAMGRVLNSASGTLAPGNYKQFNLSFTIPAGTPAGNYTFTLQLVNDVTGAVDYTYNETVTVLPPGQPDFELENVNIPEYSWQYQPVTVTGYIENNGTASGNYIVTLLINGNVADTTTGSLDPDNSDYFELSAQINDSGTFEINVTAAIATIPPQITDSKSGSITVAPDGDKDCWNDTVEGIIKEYNPDFDLADTPTKDDIVQAVTNAIVEYIITEDPQIKSDIIAMVKEYLRERPETCPV